MTKLQEKAALSAHSGKWLVQLLSEGQGSSANYPGEVLQRDGAAAWPAGTHIYMDHLTESAEHESGGVHSIKDLVGVTLTEAMWDEDSKSLRAETKWFNDYGKFIEEAKDYIGLSIEASAVVNEGVLESLTPSPLNAVAVVPRAGRDGKVLNLIESFRETSGNIVPNEHDEGKRVVPVTPEDIKSVAEAVAAALEPTLTKITEALKPAEPAGDDEPDAVDRAEVVEKAVEAGLGKTARERVLAAVDGGKTVEEAISAEQALRDEIIKESASAATFVGRVQESGSDSDDYRTKGW